MKFLRGGIEPGIKRGGKGSEIFKGGGHEFKPPGYFRPPFPSHKGRKPIVHPRCMLFTKYLPSTPPPPTNSFAKKPPNRVHTPNARQRHETVLRSSSVVGRDLGAPVAAGITGMILQRFPPKDKSFVYLRRVMSCGGGSGCGGVGVHGDPAGRRRIRRVRRSSAGRRRGPS